MLVVDDHALFRRGLQMVLEQEDDIEVVGEAERRAGGRQQGRGELLPDIVLMDVRMPRRGGHRGVRRAAREASRPPRSSC